MTALSRGDIEKLIDDWIFKEKYRRILKRRMLDGIGFEDLAEEVEMSTRQVKNIVYSCEKIIIKHMVE